MNRRDAIKAAVGVVAGAALPTPKAAKNGVFLSAGNGDRCRVFDRFGREWKQLRWVHTGSWMCEQYVLDITGQKQLTADMMALKTSVHRLPGPLTIVDCTKPGPIGPVKVGV